MKLTEDVVCLRFCGHIFQKRGEKKHTKKQNKVSGPNSTILALSPAFSQSGIKNWHWQQLCISPRSAWVSLSFFGFVTNGSVAFPGSNKTQWWVLDYIHSKRAPRQSASGLCCPQPLAMNVRAKVSGYTHHWNQTHLDHMRNILEGGIQHLSPQDKGIALQPFPVFISDDPITHCLLPWRQPGFLSNTDLHLWKENSMQQRRQIKSWECFLQKRGWTSLNTKAYKPLPVYFPP